MEIKPEKPLYYLEKPSSHRVSIAFSLPEGGIDMAVFNDIHSRLGLLQEEFGADLGLQSLQAHFDVASESLRVICLVEGMFLDAEAVVPIVTEIIEGHGVDIPFGRPAYRVQEVAAA